MSLKDTGICVVDHVCSLGMVNEVLSVLLRGLRCASELFRRLRDGSIVSILHGRLLRVLICAEITSILRYIRGLALR